MTTITFTVLGAPLTKGSVVAFVPRRRDGSWATYPSGAPKVVKHDDTGARGKSAMATLATSALQARMEAGIGQVLREAQVELHLRFFVARPKGHFGSKGLKDRAPLRPAKRPDLDKYIRHVMDALKGVVYSDDSQVVALHATKEFDELPRTEIEVSVCARQTVGRLVPSEQMSLAA